mgnify:CR=1 FL=1
MLKCCSLYSGSSGNSFLIQSNHTKLLIDAGVSCKKLETALNDLNISPDEIQAVLVTHEHVDHTKGLPILSSKYNIPIYANEKTWNHINSDKISDDNKRFFSNNTKFDISDLVISPFSTPHDAADPCGFNIYNDSKKISIATDLGNINETIFNNLKSSSLIFLESNYDMNILKYSHYPYRLKQRIASSFGHLENCTAGKTIAKLIDFGLKEAFLIHLSKENNFPELANKTVWEELQKCNFSSDDICINVAPRDNTSKIAKVI